MPSTATITAYYSFTGGTKARASQVQNNFDMLRGHIIPIDPNTQTAANGLYDLGSTEWRWRALYLKADAGSLTAAVGGFGLGVTLAGASFLTTTSSPVAGTTVTISTIGRPVTFGFTPCGNGVGYIGLVGTTTTGDYSIVITLMRDGATISTAQFSMGGGATVNRDLPPASFTFIDFPAAGTYKYSVNALLLGTPLPASAIFNRCRPYAKEF